MGGGIGIRAQSSGLQTRRHRSHESYGSIPFRPYTPLSPLYLSRRPSLTQMSDAIIIDF